MAEERGEKKKSSLHGSGEAQRNQEEGVKGQRKYPRSYLHNLSKSHSVHCNNPQGHGDDLRCPYLHPQRLYIQIKSCSEALNGHSLWTGTPYNPLCWTPILFSSLRCEMHTVIQTSRIAATLLPNFLDFILIKPNYYNNHIEIRDCLNF